MRHPPLVVILVLAACRPDPGDPVYPERPPWRDPSSDFLEGPDPWVGQPRLAIGAFYEGGATDEIPIDNTTSFLYVYDSTFVFAVSEERVEGTRSDVFVANGVGWMGGGIHWEGVVRDLSDWDTLHVSLMSVAPASQDMTIGMAGGGTERQVPVVDHGFTADGAWHNLAIPLAAFAGVDLTQVGIPMNWIIPGTTAGDEILIDNVYLAQGGE